MQLALSAWIFLGSAALAEVPVDLPPSIRTTASANDIALQWDTSVGQVYQLESSSVLSESWDAIGEPRIGTGLPMTYGEIRTGNRKFFRISVSPEDFEPANLSPKWQLDAQNDFVGAAEGQPVGQWAGSGISSVAQSVVGDRPVFHNGAVVFDGQGDNLSFPMWQGGIGQQWTLAVLLKIRQGVQLDRSFFGCDVTASRALDISFRDTGLYSFTPGYKAILRSDECAAHPSDNWRVLLLRSTGTTLKVHFDWYEGEINATPPTTAQQGRFNLGCGYWAGTTSSPITVRYASFFPQALSDDDAAKMLRWMERKKSGEYPPVTVIYGGGQSNYLGSIDTMRREFPAALGNVSLAFGRQYGASPLNLWMNDNADLTGFEVCPFYDLSGAPAGSGAAWVGENHSGTRILESWNLRASHLKRHPKMRKVCVFIQGETDGNDATKLWRPNGDGQWNLTYTDPYWMGDSYGRRSVAWNEAIRQSTGHQDMIFIYERVAVTPGYPLTAVQIEAAHRQRASQMMAMSGESRYLLVDTTGFPRHDGVHFSSPQYQAAEIPNTGTERFCRAAVRLINSSERLATMSYDARMIAMRAIDSGAELSEAGFQACENLAAIEGFADLKSLVIPTLVSSNTVDQERLRRCDLLLHRGGKYAVGFLSETPPNATAVCAQGADIEALQQNIGSFLTALGVPGLVSISMIEE